MKKVLVGKFGDGSTLYFVPGAIDYNGVVKIGSKETVVPFWDFAHNRSDLEKLEVTTTQQELWSERWDDQKWRDKYFGTGLDGMPEEEYNPYNEKVHVAINGLHLGVKDIFRNSSI
jgi:hypothetical protein